MSRHLLTRCPRHSKYVWNLMWQLRRLKYDSAVVMHTIRMNLRAIFGNNWSLKLAKIYKFWRTWEHTFIPKMIWKIVKTACSIKHPLTKQTPCLISEELSYNFGVRMTFLRKFGNFPKLKKCKNLEIKKLFNKLVGSSA